MMHWILSELGTWHLTHLESVHALQRLGFNYQTFIGNLHFKLTLFLIFQHGLESVQLQHRTSFASNRRSRASQSYDDLEDHYAALNIGKSSRHGYAKIRPRNRPMMDPSQTSKSQDISLGPSSHLLNEQMNPIGTTKSQVCQK